MPTHQRVSPPGRHHAGPAGSLPSNTRPSVSVSPREVGRRTSLPGVRTMHRILLALALAAPAVSPSALADGLLVPRDRSLPPLGLARQEVRVVIDGQVADTTVKQVFRNTTDRDLEADYLFPLPPGASVRQFAMWVGGRRMSAETLGAPQARSIYEGIVRRLEDPGLLEYMDRDLCKVRIYPVPRRGEQ